ncbi:hypothetical protein NKR19_g684 [Coniochaeta hoffmannii]|uniref:Uncharacterized protein n=1 Tax=Coniochaeta hoffmannii TaxID=91930 RepID=A0AA38S1Z0_9PEZI|nr:hypothetical protein NKR19_g684 [Coniochaeta hoffmannii]
MPPPGLTAAHATSSGISSDSPSHAHGDDGAGNHSANDNPAGASTQDARHARPVTFYDHLAGRCQYQTNARMDAPLEGPKGHQFDEYVKILRHQKTKQIALYRATNNEIILKLDWNAPGVHFNRAALFGDWVHGAKLNNIGHMPLPLPPAELVRNFVEVQIKRIDGTDDAILQACGVNHMFAFLGLLDMPKETSDKENYKANDKPSDKAQSDKGKDTATKSRTSSSSNSTVAGLMAASPGGWPCEPTKSSGDDNTKPASEAATETTTEPGPSKPASSSTAITEGTLPIHFAPAVVNGSSPSAPRASPASPAASPFPRSWAEASSSSSSDNPAAAASEDGTIPEEEDPEEEDLEAAFLTARAVRGEIYDAAKSRLYDTTFAFPKFPALKADAALYLVRVVGIPNPPGLATSGTSGTNGPYKRFATLLGMGGWVVEDGEKFDKGGGEGKTGRMPARQVMKDWTFSVPEEIDGEALPVWKGEREPGLEDVYAMVWDLVMRRKFLGVVRGYGFGVRKESEGRPLRELMKENPFTTQE